MGLLEMRDGMHGLISLSASTSKTFIGLLEMRDDRGGDNKVIAVSPGNPAGVGRKTHASRPRRSWRR